MKQSRLQIIFASIEAIEAMEVPLLWISDRDAFLLRSFVVTAFANKRYGSYCDYALFDVMAIFRQSSRSEGPIAFLTIKTESTSANLRCMVELKCSLDSTSVQRYEFAEDTSPLTSLSSVSCHEK